jgi:hypothetical protein
MSAISPQEIEEKIQKRFFWGWSIYTGPKTSFLGQNGVNFKNAIMAIN